MLLANSFCCSVLLSTPLYRILQRSLFPFSFIVYFSLQILAEDINKKGKVIPVTGRGGPQGCETSRLPHFLDNLLTDV
jgi:hypothetical protein